MTTRKTPAPSPEVEETPAPEQRSSTGSVNRVTLVGRLVADPTARTTPSGIPVTTVRIATNERGSAEFHDVVLWAQLCTFAKTYLGKGRLVYVEGRLQSRTWQAADGSSRRTVEVVANRLQALSRRPAEEQAS